MRNDMRVIHSSEIADDPAAFAGDYVPLEDAEVTIAALRAEIADAREACPSIRMQDHCDAPLLALVNLEVSRGFNRDAEIHKLRALLAVISSRPVAGITVNDFVCAVGEMTNEDALQRVKELVRADDARLAARK